MELSRDDRKTVLQPEQAAAFRCETASPDQNRLRLTPRKFSSLDAAGLRVEVVAELEGGEPVSRWGISVDKPAAVGLEEIRFPRLYALRRQAERLAVPPGWDSSWPIRERRSAARRAAAARLGLSRRVSFCLAYYQNGGCGLSTSCDDAASSRKTFAFWGDGRRRRHHGV